MKNNIIAIFCCLPAFVWAQKFDYKAEILNTTSQWQEIKLDKEILSKVSENLSDIRIYEFSDQGDTLEVPYFIKRSENVFTEKGVNFKLLNQVKKDGDLYLSFKTINDIEVNEISLNLNEENFNYNLDLEASNDQKEWFEVLEDYRILSIKNDATDYQFTTISFPTTSYNFYRLRIKNAENASLKSASIKQKQTILGSHQSYENNIYQTEKEKTSYITINLEDKVPINNVNLYLNKDQDYHRAITIKYLVDSVKTDKGWIENYRGISNQYLSSLEAASFDFETVFTNKLLLEISNLDNQALSIKKAEVKGPEYKIIARYGLKDHNSFIAFGNSSVNKPQYDLLNFKENIPNDINVATIGEIINLKAPEVESTFLNNKLWLWAVLFLIIALLAYSSFGMLKKNSETTY